MLTDMKYDNFLKKVEIYSGKDDDITIYAHRGFSSLEIENSKEAIEICQDYDCIDGIEVDVSMTKDGRLVLLHTDYTGHNTNLSTPIQKTRFSDLKGKLFTGNFSIPNLSSRLEQDIMKNIVVDRSTALNSKSVTVETFEWLLETYDQDKILLLDIKFNDKQRLMIKKIGELLSKVDNSNIIIQSDSYRWLSKMRSKFSKFTYQLIISKPAELKYLDSDFSRFAIRRTLVTYDIIKNTLSKGKKITVWTVNSDKNLSLLVDEAREYFDDISYITDYPDCISVLLDQKVKKKEK